jgi:transcriptional regulator with XRE-family HTH domain
MSLGSEICGKRKAMKLSQEDFANIVGVARQTVSSWERDIFMPDGNCLLAISKAFSCSIDDLVNPPLPPTPEEPEQEPSPESGEKQPEEPKPKSAA